MVNIKQIQINEIYNFKSYMVNSSVFNSKDWLKIYGDKILIFGIFNYNDEFIGSFFLYQQTKKGISIITNPPFSPSCGLFFINPSKNIASKYSFDKKVLNEIAVFINNQNALIKTFSLPTNFI